MGNFFLGPGVFFSFAPKKKVTLKKPCIKRKQKAFRSWEKFWLELGNFKSLVFFRLFGGGKDGVQIKDFFFLL